MGKKMDEKELALGKRWKRVAAYMGLRVGGWTDDYRALFITPEGSAVTIENPSRFRLLPHLETQFGITK